MKDKDTYWLYRVIRWLVWLFSPKFKIVGAENLPDEPYSIGILSVGLKDKELSAWFKAALTVFVVMVCLAVCFVKQHSSLDVLAALPVCLIAELAVYGKDYWKLRCRFVLGKTKKRIS